MSKKNKQSTEDIRLLEKLIIGIGEASAITRIPARQIRYWEEKGIIKSLAGTKGKNRRYNYANIKKMIVIKGYIDEGFTLAAAAEKSQKKNTD